MRISHVKGFVALFVGALLISACGAKPEPAQLPDKTDVPKGPTKKDYRNYSMPAALWFTTSNVTNGGKLGRLDLSTGEIKREALGLLKPDTQIFEDGKDGLFLLTRMGLDSITVLRGPEAKVAAYHGLPERSNAQGVARDSKGRIWVTMRESNDVAIFSSDLREKVGSVDLSRFKESDAPGALADLAQVVAFDDRHMIVTAQRLHRRVDGWHPAERSGLAWIDIETLMPASSGLVDLANPIQAAVENGKVCLVGAGDQSIAGGILGRFAEFSVGSFTMEGPEDLGAKIIAADLSVPDEDPAIIAWYPNENKSCLQIGQTRLVCDGSEANRGFVFNPAIKRAGGSIFAAYVGSGQAELWIIGSDGEGLRKVPMDLPIQSLSFGP